eukprot:224247-Alexandrium_andersonii.AAC.1
MVAPSFTEPPPCVGTGTPRRPRARRVEEGRGQSAGRRPHKPRWLPLAAHRAVECLCRPAHPVPVPDGPAGGGRRGQPHGSASPGVPALRGAPCLPPAGPWGHVG